MPSIHVECRPDHSDFSPRMFAAKKTELLHLNLSKRVKLHNNLLAANLYSR